MYFFPTVPFEISICLSPGDDVVRASCPFNLSRFNDSPYSMGFSFSLFGLERGSRYYVGLSRRGTIHRRYSGRCAAQIPAQKPAPAALSTCESASIPARIPARPLSLAKLVHPSLSRHCRLLIIPSRRAWTRVRPEKPMMPTSSRRRRSSRRNSCFSCERPLQRPTNR